VQCSNLCILQLDAQLCMYLSSLAVVQFRPLIHLIAILQAITIKPVTIILDVCI